MDTVASPKKIPTNVAIEEEVARVAQTKFVARQERAREQAGASDAKKTKVKTTMLKGGKTRRRKKNSKDKMKLKSAATDGQSSKRRKIPHGGSP
jgi:hypothetical protein